MNEPDSACPRRKTRFTQLLPGLLVIVLAAGTSPSYADNINVLWYSYADPTSEYRSSIANLAANVTTFTDNPSANTWNLTYFEPGDTPSFGGYDVLVIHSGEAWRTQPAGQPPPYATPDYSGILNNKAAIESTRGSRTFITGSDADFHAIREDSGNDAPDNADNWDGAIGYVVNAVNWAAAGTGLNVVSFYDGAFPGSFWWLDEDSFLRDELNGHAVTSLRDESPLIVDANHPLNAGLTSLGLSNWTISFHGGFDTAPFGYSRVIDSTAQPGAALAIATTVGDLNGDGIRSVADLLWLQQVIIGQRSLNIAQQRQADLAPVGGDGVIDIADLIALQQALAP